VTKSAINTVASSTPRYGWPSNVARTDTAEYLQPEPDDPRNPHRDPSLRRERGRRRKATKLRATASANVFSSDDQLDVKLSQVVSNLQAQLWPNGVYEPKPAPRTSMSSCSANPPVRMGNRLGTRAAYRFTSRQ
jgi:hypothetical protein